MKLSEPADFKTDPGFENCPRFVGVIEQNKLQQTFPHDCIIKWMKMNKIFEKVDFFNNLVKGISRLAFDLFNL